MKKVILFLVAFFIATFSFGQNGVVKKNLTPIMKKDMSLAHKLMKQLPYSSPKDTFINVTGEPIGITNYDLQTNSAVAHRMLLFDNGEISAVWTDYDGSDLPSAPERGTGYNHYNGSWQFTESSNVHIEGSQRTGWPALLTDQTNEWVVNHYRDAGGLFLWNQAIGASNTGWTQGAITGTPEAMLWPRSVSVPGHFYVISSDDQTTDATSVEALWFSVSDDGGTTWSTTKMQDFNTYYTHGNGDQYAIDAKDSIVAVVFFGDYADTKLWKSTDYGQTWTIRTVVDFPIDAFDNNAAIVDLDSNSVADTIETTDNSGDVIIDNSGMVHVVFSTMRYLDETTGDNGALAYFPYTDGLYYWNDTMPDAQYTGLDHDNFLALPSNAELIAYSFDLNGNDTIWEFAQVGSGEWPFGTYYTNLTSFGTLSVDTSNNIYVTFSTVMEGDNFVNSHANPNSESYRHQWVLARTANGEWGDPKCISVEDGNLAENVYATVPRRITDTYYSWTQWDNEPGLKIQGDKDNQTDNYIIFRAVPVEQLLPPPVVGVKELASNNINISVSPNPAVDYLRISGVDNADISIYNTIGEVVLTSKAQGTTSINVSSLPAGTYIVKATSEKGIASTKFVKVQ